MEDGVIAEGGASEEAVWETMKRGKWEERARAQEDSILLGQNETKGKRFCRRAASQNKARCIEQRVGFT